MKETIERFIPKGLLNLYHFFLALLGALVYYFPSREIRVVGLTGTNGKTTTAEMAAEILEEAGYRVALIDSIRFKIGEKEWKNELRMTMPGRFAIQRFLRQAVRAGCQYAILEVTSEGILQHRQRFVHFEIALLTNLTPEHIERHGGFENYKRAKGRLFGQTKGKHIVNLDDENAGYFLAFPAREKWGYKIETESQPPEIKNIDRDSGIRLIEAKDVRYSRKGISFRAGETDFNLKTLGSFNVYNALAAISVGLSQGVALEKSKTALQKFKGVPGRMEEVVSEPFKVIVDYAFTPNALRKVYETLGRTGSRKLICLLGACGGGRDKWKRPILGAIAARYCREIIITNEDPYDEDPMEIINEVAKGVMEEAGKPGDGRPRPSLQKILDRREAIRKALKIAAPGETVVITGKGSEPSICLAGGRKIPWDDRKIVREEFRRLK